MTYAWALWGNRNDVRHGRKRKDERMLLHWAVQYLEKYRVAIELLPSAQESVQHVQRRFLPPVSVFKFNIDDAVFAKLNSVGVGVMVRDWNGQFLVAMSRKIHAPLGPLEAEAKAFELGLQFAKQLGIIDFIHEGDSLIVSRALNHSSSIPVSIDAVIMGIGKASLEFHNVDFSHVK